MEDNTQIEKLYSVGYCGTIDGKGVPSEEFAAFYEKEPDGTVGASNYFALANGIRGGYQSDAGARFAVKKVLYEYFNNTEGSEADRLAGAMRLANNQIFDYAGLQSETMQISFIGAVVTEGKVVVGNVGENHAYIIRNGKVFQITEDAYNEDGSPVVSAMGCEKDAVIDIYDGIEVRPNDILLLCSRSMDTLISKKEILEAAEENTPRGIVENLLKYPEANERGISASVAAVKIYDEEGIGSAVRYDGTIPADTDINTEAKEISMIRRSRSRTQAGSSDGNKGDKLPLAILGILLGLLLIGGIVWAAVTGKMPGNLFPPKYTPTPTIDAVAETVSVMELTMEAEKIQAVKQTVEAWPTQTPYPTPTEVFIDFAATEAAYKESIRATEAVANPEPAPAQDEEPAADETLKENTVDAGGNELIYIPAGTFLLGTGQDDESFMFEEESPQLEVYLSGYWINKTEITNAQYKACVEAGSCLAGAYMNLYDSTQDDYPVTYVTLDQAEGYCGWIGGRLPTEYEWEKAARGTDGRTYPWGEEEPSDENALANIPNFVAEDGETYGIFPVGSFPGGASPYGLMDMAGNVWEWTGTYYGSNTYEMLQAEAEESGETIKDPDAPEYGNTNVIRGGSCASTEQNYYTTYLRTTNRGYINGSSSYYVGFRCVVPDNNGQTDNE